MRKADFEELVTIIRQAGAIRRGERRPRRVFRFRPADVKRIRLRLGRSQARFALMIGASVATLRDWQQGRRVPEGLARAFLKVAAEEPEAVAEALGA